MMTFVLSSLWAGPGIARRFKPDLVFAFFGFPCGPVARRIRRKLGVPYALSLRGSDVPRPELGHHRLLERAITPVLRGVWREAGAIVAVGEGLKQAALKIEPGLNIEVIPNGVDTERFKPGPARTGKEFRLLFVGRLRDFKGAQHVLEALGGAEELAPVRFDIVGDGPYGGELERMARAKGLGGRVVFHGWAAPEETPAFYREADAFILPSYAEGSPNVVLEAMASGLPVIVSDGPGLRESVRDGVEGFVTPARDAGAIRAALGRLVHDREARRRMGEAGLARAREQSWAGVARRHVAIFERVLAAGKP